MQIFAHETKSSFNADLLYDQPDKTHKVTNKVAHKLISK